MTRKTKGIILIVIGVIFGLGMLNNLTNPKIDGNNPLNQGTSYALSYYGTTAVFAVLVVLAIWLGTKMIKKSEKDDPPENKI